MIFLIFNLLFALFCYTRYLTIIKKIIENFLQSLLIYLQVNYHLSPFEIIVCLISIIIIQISIIITFYIRNVNRNNVHTLHLIKIIFIIFKNKNSWIHYDFRLLIKSSIKSFIQSIVRKFYYFLYFILSKEAMYIVCTIFLIFTILNVILAYFGLYTPSLIEKPVVASSFFIVKWTMVKFITFIIISKIKNKEVSFKQYINCLTLSNLLYCLILFWTFSFIYSYYVLPYFVMLLSDIILCKLPVAMVKTIGTGMIYGPTPMHKIGKILILWTDYNLNVKKVNTIPRLSIELSSFYPTYIKGSLADKSVRNVKCFGGFSNMMHYPIIKVGHPWRILPSSNPINVCNTLVKNTHINIYNIANLKLVGVFRYDNYVRVGVLREGKNNTVELLYIKDIEISEFDFINSGSTPLYEPINYKKNFNYLFDNISDKKDNRNNLLLDSDLLNYHYQDPSISNLTVMMQNDIRYDNTTDDNITGQQYNNMANPSDYPGMPVCQDVVMPNQVYNNIAQNANTQNPVLVAPIDSQQYPAVHSNVAIVQNMNVISRKYPCIQFGSIMSNNQKIISLNFDLAKLQSDLKLDYLHELCLAGRNYLLGINHNLNDTRLKDIIYDNKDIYSCILRVVDQLYNYNNPLLAAEVCIFNSDFLRFFDNNSGTGIVVNSLRDNGEVTSYPNTGYSYDNGEGSSAMAVPSDTNIGYSWDNGEGSSAMAGIIDPNLKNVQSSSNNGEGSSSMAGPSDPNIIYSWDNGEGYNTGNLMDFQGSFHYMEGVAGPIYTSQTSNTPIPAYLDTPSNRYLGVAGSSITAGPSNAELPSRVLAPNRELAPSNRDLGMAGSSVTAVPSNAALTSRVLAPNRVLAPSNRDLGMAASSNLVGPRNPALFSGVLEPRRVLPASYRNLGVAGYSNTAGPSNAALPSRVLGPSSVPPYSVTLGPTDNRFNNLATFLQGKLDNLLNNRALTAMSITLTDLDFYTKGKNRLFYYNDEDSPVLTEVYKLYPTLFSNPGISGWSVCKIRVLGLIDFLRHHP